MADTIKVVTVNCQGLSTPSKRTDVLNFYKSKKYSIISFQDTHFIPDLEPFIESQWGYKCIFNSNCSNSRGVAFFSRNKKGLNMINLEAFISSLKCTWIRRLLTGGQSWINIFVANFGKDFHRNLVDYGDDYVLQLAKATNNQFWKDVFMEWQNTIKVTYLENSTKSEVPLAPVWYNSKITINHTSVFFDKWYEKGVKL